MIHANLSAPLKLVHQLYPFLWVAANANKPTQVIFVSLAHAASSTPLCGMYIVTKVAFWIDSISGVAPKIITIHELDIAHSCFI